MFGSLVDLIEMEQIDFEGSFGETIRRSKLQGDVLKRAEDARRKLVEQIADVDDVVAQLYLEDSRKNLLK